MAGGGRTRRNLIGIGLYLLFGAVLVGASVLVLLWLSYGL